jgi:cytochrome c-type biogenesis protein
VLVELLDTIATSFALGIATSVTAFCVIVLYPAFLARLARQVSDDPDSRENRRILGTFGLLVTAGVIAFMALVGFLFTYVFEQSIGQVIQIISPIAFAVLFVIGILLMFDVKFSRQVRPLTIGNPYVSAFVYGFFFGAIVIPCNPGFIALAFARASTIPVGQRMLSFIAFGVGIGAPLLAFSLVSRANSRWTINFLVDHKRTINLVAGAIMAAIAAYYLLFVFKVQDSIVGLFS